MGSWRSTIINRIILTSFLLLSGVVGGLAQFYTTGTDPAYLKWQQIRTEHFRIIFPEDFGEEAPRMAHILDSYYEQNSAALNHRPRPIPVIIHNHSVRSNGYVAWAPKRMELVTTPSAMNESQDHLEQLALHEFRHVVQIDKLRQGFTKGLSWVLGEAGQGAVTGMLPFWYLEGDATDAETRLSMSGRGRLPGFSKEIRGILLDVPERYSYEKAVFGSYRDYVPDHYRYGYQMVSHARNAKGNELWEKTIDYTARNPFTLYPVYFGLKRYGSWSKTGLYREAMDSLQVHWEKRDAAGEWNGFTRLNQRDDKHYTSYRFPRYLGNGKIFAEKSGMDQIPEFIMIDRQGNEMRIRRPGFYHPANIAVSGSKIAWAEQIPDIRWERRSYSEIKIYDLERRLEYPLRPKTKYFSPDISPDGLWVAVVESDHTYQHTLVILNAVTGDEVSRIPSPGNEHLQYPVWARNQEGIYLTALGTEGKRIRYYRMDAGTWSTLFQAGRYDIAELDAGEDYLVFRGTFSGIDNIYALDLQTQEVRKVTSSRLGAYAPDLSANAQKMLYSDYTSQGYDIVEIPFTPDRYPLLTAVSDPGELRNLPGADDEAAVITPSSHPSRDYESKPYRKITNLFGLHSWAPLYVDIDDPSIEEIPVSAGVMALSQNHLGTATTVLGYEYKGGDHFMHADFSYSGLYPVLKLSADVGGQPAIAPPPEGIDLPEQVQTGTRLGVQAYIPFNITRNRYLVGFRPTIDLSYRNTYYFYTGSRRWKSGMSYLDYSFYYTNTLKRGVRDILPRFGHVIQARYVDTPFESEQKGSRLHGSATLYLPGIMQHHTLRLYGGIDREDPNRFWLGRLLMAFPRGWQNYNNMKLQKASVDYVFPVAYPDWNVWRAAYIKRFRGGLFYDYAWGENVDMRPVESDFVSRSFQSVGLEFSTDVYLAQFLVPLNIGARFIHLPESGSNRWELIFGMDLSQF